MRRGIASQLALQLCAQLHAKLQLMSELATPALTGEKKKNCHSLTKISQGHLKEGLA